MAGLWHCFTPIKPHQIHQIPIKSHHYITIIKHHETTMKPP